jgi:hypothetical protein
MTHRQKVDRHVAESKKVGVPPSTAAPPLFRLLWAPRVEVPPPLFLGFFPLFLVMGGFVGVVWGALSWLLLWQFLLMSVMDVISAAVAVGLLFGLWVAVYYRWKAKKMGLPTWDCYPGA